MKIVVTGANGFIGKNLQIHLRENGHASVICLDRENSQDDLDNALFEADFVYHLAGVNRPQNDVEFYEGNTNLTEYIVAKLTEKGSKTPLLITSSIQAATDNHYGKSKAAAEKAVRDYATLTGAKVYIYRLPNVFGKWCRPNYNSAVATFCFNILNGLEVKVNDPQAALNLVYIDDVCKYFLKSLVGEIQPENAVVEPIYKTTVGEVVSIIQSFKANQNQLLIDKVGVGLTRALYSTFISYYEPAQFSYSVKRHSDPRGSFVEMLKTQDSGQFSFFTAHPGITRGGHYHHTKNEKFLVIKGKAKFCFRHIVTNEYYELFVDAEESKVVETVPGWSHDITNIGNDEMIVMLWANEIFDPSQPDTVTYKIS
ncbi:UDP-2-acetamido-2,6-beta-L-arabino-hexul-4-ose reductase [Buttiauxella izardii]|uniref:SDR family oxidoreductase n=1 Tax=Buttiauxella izardii TaxID=82991 RepID=A0A3A5JW56_9ENTR|nr:NAD-dependent epimerase/dehydratase family protein [Buttiauxella izardii]RJT27291.1 SDR family oxidoreductase [Buttiauxella izardii]